ncbi:MAG TPA: DUF2917 domain-containing protein [Accumulibacter sp.]|jgi:hypothetical protein|nr:DUF2917 domain-containing protein [Accumulibacter sp.]
MVILLPSIEVAVAATEAASFTGIAGWTLTSLSDSLWLTEERNINGDPDIWLLPGDAYRVAGAGRVVVEAWRRGAANSAATARIRLTPPAARVRPWRWPRFFVDGATVASVGNVWRLA